MHSRRVGSAWLRMAAKRWPRDWRESAASPTWQAYDAKCDSRSISSKVELPTTTIVVLPTVGPVGGSSALMIGSA